ncbi:MAG: CrcB family protein [Acidimicrobiaceae bacterium]|nr:CrcB family protein [Acidimicrobiaceae bacterium]
MTLLLVTLAGSLGCIVRYLMEYSVRRHHPTMRPWATVAANALGCALAGWAAYHLTSSLNTNIRSIVITGFCGGLTTFSSAFAIPVLLTKEHHWGYSATIVVCTPVLCGLFFAFGAAIAH